MLAPFTFQFSQVDPILMSAGTVTPLLAARLLGGMVGLAREWTHKASGLRTNMPACAFFTLKNLHESDRTGHVMTFQDADQD